MFIELDVWNGKDSKFNKQTINVKRIDEFYPDMIQATKIVATRIHLNYPPDGYSVLTKQSYEEVRDLLSMVSLLVNE